MYPIHGGAKIKNKSAINLLGLLISGILKKSNPITHFIKALKEGQ